MAPSLSSRLAPRGRWRPTTASLRVCSPQGSSPAFSTAGSSAKRRVDDRSLESASGIIMAALRESRPLVLRQVKLPERRLCDQQAAGQNCGLAVSSSALWKALHKADRFQLAFLHEALELHFTASVEWGHAHCRRRASGCVSAGLANGILRGRASRKPVA